MLIEAPIENLFSCSLAGDAKDEGRGNDEGIDWLDLTWEECARRAIRKQTRGGRVVRTLLKLGQVLQHGDVLLRDSRNIVAVNLLPCEVFVVEPKSSAQAVALAYKLGDLHVPMEWSDAELITPCDGPIQAVFHEAGIAYRTETRRFQPTLRSTTVQMTLAKDFEVHSAR